MSNDNTGDKPFNQNEEPTSPRPFRDSQQYEGEDILDIRSHMPPKKDVPVYSVGWDKDAQCTEEEVKDVPDIRAQYGECRLNGCGWEEVLGVKKKLSLGEVDQMVMTGLYGHDWTIW